MKNIFAMLFGAWKSSASSASAAVCLNHLAPAKILPRGTIG